MHTVKTDVQSTVLLTAHDVECWRRDRRILRAVALEVRRNDKIAVMGGNGSGKSTFLKALACLDEFAAGRISAGPHDVVRPGSRHVGPWPTVGMVFQEPNLWPHMTVARNLTIAASTAPDDTWMRTSIEHLCITPLLDRNAARLSGGQAQLVALARGLSSSPTILLADEVTSGLDETNTERAMELLKRYASSGRAVLLVTHSLEIASDFANRLFLVKDGAVSEVADWDTRRALLSAATRDLRQNLS